MNIKPSEIRFKFPIRLYEKTKDEDSVYSLNRKPAFIAAFARVFIDDIQAWSETFPRHRDLDTVVKMGGPDCTQIIMKNGDEYFCDWNREKFEENYDNHISWLEEASLSMQEEEEQPFLFEINEDNYKDLEKGLRVFKKELKKLQKLETPPPNE